MYTKHPQPHPKAPTAAPLKVGIGEELPAPRGDEAWGQEVVLRLDRVGRDCDSDGARDQSHLSTCRRGESVWEAQRSRPCRPTRRRSGSDGGDRRRSARRRRTRRRGGSGNGIVDRRRSERRRGVHRCGGSSGAGVTVGKACALSSMGTREADDRSRRGLQGC